MNSTLGQQLYDIINMIGSQRKGGAVIQYMIDHDMLNEAQAKQILSEIDQIIKHMKDSAKRKQIQKKIDKLKLITESEQQAQSQEEKQAELILQNL